MQYEERWGIQIQIQSLCTLANVAKQQLILDPRKMISGIKTFFFHLKRKLKKEA